MFVELAPMELLLCWAPCQALLEIKELAPEAKGIHCFIHRYTLASKTLPSELKYVLDLVVKIVNFIKAGSLNTGQFKELYKVMTHECNARNFTFSHSCALAFKRLRSKPRF